MEDLKLILNQQLHRQLQLIQNKRLYPFTDWTLLQRIVSDHLVPCISKEVTELLKEKEESSSKLRAKLNQLKFGCDPERDKEIVELYNQGLSRGKIAKEVDMSKWGVSKALRRLGTQG